MNTPRNLLFGSFGDANDPITDLQSTQNSTQLVYLQNYLLGLGAKNFLCEQNYFDRDYLHEFSSFYSVSAFGYSNICRRVHYFSHATFDRDLFSEAIGGDDIALRQIRDSYLGFIIIRPIHAAPIGRTVLKWFQDLSPDAPRVTHPSRTYISHVVGIELEVDGLAWQQQDSAVASCATVGLWTIMHSSAFDARHAIPTTVELTEAAHRGYPNGNKLFPSQSLEIIQVLEAIKSQDLNPLKITGEIDGLFSKERFANSAASFIRSGYPVIVSGIHVSLDQNQGAYVVNAPIGHVVCVVGFREAPLLAARPNTNNIQDEQIEMFYIHDDNIGPNVRFKATRQAVLHSGRRTEACVLEIDTPSYQPEVALVGAGQAFLPLSLIAAVHEELRISPDSLHLDASNLSAAILDSLNTWLNSIGAQTQGITYSSRYFLLSDYIGDELARILEGEPALLSQVRLNLQEKIAPMSLHLGLIRIALPDSSVLVDVLVDTSMSDRHKRVFGHVVFDPSLKSVLDSTALNLGVSISAFLESDSA